jgi:hypothetical protein
MKAILDNSTQSNPLVSVVLVDWSCRESYHALHYLNHQSIARDQYEIIWIEFYDRQAEGIHKRLEEDRKSGSPLSLDQWIALGFSHDLCHHKHLMYNVGITAARGRIVTFCDSDAMLKPSFVESIIGTFNYDKNPDFKDSGAVLHCDEVRNSAKRFYPFGYPEFEEVLGEGCINWEGTTTTGLADENDFLHRRNYGACMSALKKDLIAIGGADEHLDYLGHICGPYEMTFRLCNYGIKEYWHPSEFLYHTWHPGTDGEYDHLGPHDGHHMSSTAITAKTTGRVLPLKENPAIQKLRQSEKIPDRATLIKHALEVDHSLWNIKSLKKLDQKRTVTSSTLKNIVGQFMERAVRSLKKHKTLKGLMRAIFYTSFFYLRDLVRQNTQIQVNCKLFLDSLASEKEDGFAIMGTGEVAEHLYALTKQSPIHIQGVYDSPSGGSFHDSKISSVEDLSNYPGKVVIGTHDDVERRVDILLKKLNIAADRIIVL